MRPDLPFAVATAVALAGGATAAGPDLGRVASPEAVARADISIGPFGETLPPGSGTVAEGERVYAAKCVVCHGDKGAGIPGDRLTGGVGSLTSARPVRTVASFWPYATTVFDYTRRAMPLNAPQSLTNSEVYAVTAYILSIDGIVAPDARLDAASLVKVQMPNRNGVVSWEPQLRRPRR
jgi:mono/diheme cytochrome c family protein